MRYCNAMPFLLGDLKQWAIYQALNEQFNFEGISESSETALLVGGLTSIWDCLSSRLIKDRATWHRRDVSYFIHSKDSISGMEYGENMRLIFGPGPQKVYGRS